MHNYTSCVTYISPSNSCIARYLIQPQVRHATTLVPTYLVRIVLSSWFFQKNSVKFLENCNNTIATTDSFFRTAWRLIIRGRVNTDSGSMEGPVRHGWSFSAFFCFKIIASLSIPPDSATATAKPLSLIELRLPHLYLSLAFSLLSFPWQ